MSENRRIYSTQDCAIALIVVSRLTLARKPFKFSADETPNGWFYNITAGSIALESIIFEHKMEFSKLLFERGTR